MRNMSTWLRESSCILTNHRYLERGRVTLSYCTRFVRIHGDSHELQAINRIIWESPQNGLQLTKNCSRIISEWFANYWELLRIVSEWFMNHSRITWESFQNGLWFTENHFRMVCESLRITCKSSQNGSLIPYEVAFL